ncbi:cell division protein ZapA [Aliidiomarina sedimenti]|uniref:Cell division protein ZapA n=2 Tax=Aliidiomarina TaxID=1249554 RepID=A0A432WEE0_9GAMM|nr:MULTISPECIES: cell division protein ZapA [Aliidiomarina]RUO28054.1 cell division protein ZapA [Aliidiomarina sedimenti]RUO31225.1 cell division protein ZapA [Aliidiomarina soli]
MSGHAMDIRLLDRNYRVMCPDGQESALREAARQLDQRLNETKSATKLTNVEQIAVMTALNICHEWIEDKTQQSKHTAALEDKVRLLQATIEKAMGEQASSQDGDEYN